MCSKCEFKPLNMKTKGNLLFIFLILVGVSFAQDNTLPATGNVGIGTLTPSARLNVKGNMIVDSCVMIQDTLFVEDGARIMSDLDVGGATKLGDVYVDGTLYLNNLQTNTDPNTFDLLVAKGDGTVMKTGFFELDPFPVPDPVGLCDVGSPYRTNPYWVDQPDVLYTACPEVNVGINTTTPRVRLDVIGAAFCSKMFSGTAIPNAGVGDLYYHMRAPFTSNTLDKTIFLVENGNRALFSINNNGLLRAREIRIDAQNWADNVFYPNYQLRPLSEVESFIRANGHLPDVPSQEEVEEEGIDMAEMDALLLKKIEELTLYTIELQKRIQELEQEKND